MRNPSFRFTRWISKVLGRDKEEFSCGLIFYRYLLYLIAFYFCSGYLSARANVYEGQNKAEHSQLSAPSRIDAQQEDKRSIGANVPFTTYEAEDRKNHITGEVKHLTALPGRVDRSPELEASGRAYVSLESAGEYLEIPVSTAANAMVIRYSIPDAPHGGGGNTTLSLYINDQHSQDSA